MRETKREKPLRISPSQIKRYRSCPRKVAYQLNTDIEFPPDVARANDLGTRCHEIAENWLRDALEPDPGEVFSYWRSTFRPDPNAPEVKPGALPGQVEERIDAHPGAIVAAGAHHLPAPKAPGLELEIEGTFETPAAIYAARADWRHEGIGDPKFLRDLNSGLSADPLGVNSFGEANYLGSDPQAIIQAAAEMVRTGAEAVPLTWVNYQTKPVGGRYRTRKVHLVVTRADVARGMKPIEEHARLINGIYEKHLDAAFASR